MHHIWSLLCCFTSSLFGNPLVQKVPVSVGIWSNVVAKHIVLMSVSRSLSDSITTPIRHIHRHMVCTVSRFSKKNIFFDLTPTGGSKTCLNRYDPEEPQYLYICSKCTTVYNFKMYHCCIIPAIFFYKGHQVKRMTYKTFSNVKCQNRSIWPKQCLRAILHAWRSLI